MADLIRASSLTRIGELIEELGGDTGAIFAGAGMDQGATATEGGFIRYSGLARLMNAAGAALGVADFGLQLSRYQDFEMFGPLSVLIRNARTLDEALTGLIRYLYTYTPAVRATVRTEGDLAAFTWEYRVRWMPSTAQLTELTCAVVLDMVQRIVGDEFQPVRIGMTHRQVSSTAVYRGYFPCPLQFEDAVNRIVFPTDDLARRVDGDQQAYVLAAQYLGSQIDREHPAGQVREVLGKLLPLGEADLPSVATALLVHPRTLQRRLQDEGLGFDDVLVEVRRTRALELITTTQLPMSVIARELGYSEQSSFARSCVRWFGMSPSKLRRLQR